MNLKSGFPFWLIKNGLPFNYPKLEKNIKTDVVVMGAGISGALVAWQLTQNNIPCVVVDARTVGLGSTCASTSLLQYEIDEPLSRLQFKAGYSNAIRAYQLCKDSIETLGQIAEKIGVNEFEFKPSLYYAAYKKDVSFLKDEFEIRKKNGFKVQWLDQKNILDQFGFDAPAAIFSKHGAQTNAYAFTHCLHQHAIKKGLQVYDRTNIESIHHGRKKVILKTDEGNIITAKKMVYATGYEVVNYISKKIVKLTSTYATISEHSNSKDLLWNKNAMIWNTADPYLYMRTTNDNRIVIGGRDEDYYSPVKRDKLVDKKAKQLQGDFNKLFPGIPFLPEFNWCGTFGSTEDGLPFIGTYSGLPNSFFALGFGGNGITFSQIAAEIITDLIMGKKNMDAEIFSFDRI